MPDITLLEQELEQIVTDRGAIRQKAKEERRELNDDERRREAELHERGQRARKLLEVEIDKKRSKDFDDLADFLEKPNYVVPRAVNPDDSGRKALLAAGWDVKNGMLLAPTSTGKTVEMYDESVLFGPMPQDEDGREFYRSTRAIFQPEYRAAFIKFMRTAIKYRSESMAFGQLSSQEQKALSEGTDAAGGFLVPPDTQAELLARLAQTSVMRRLARIVTTSRDSIVFPAVAPHSTSGSIYSSGFVGGWDVETPAFSQTDPTFQRFEVNIKKARVATKLSNDFIADSAVNILAFMAQNGAENLGLVEDNGFITGEGSGLEPLGIVNSGATTVDVESSSANTLQNTATEAAAGTGSGPKMIGLAYSVPSQYRNRASWIFCSPIEAQIRKMEDGNGRPLWPELSGSGFAPAPRNLMGYPVYNSEFVPDDGTDANQVLIFGDIGQYIIAQRSQISTTILRERFADTDQTGIILTERVGGGMWNTDAIRLGIV